MKGPGSSIWMQSNKFNGTGTDATVYAMKINLGGIVRNVFLYGCYVVLSDAMSFNFLCDNCSGLFSNHQRGVIRI